MRLWHQDLLQKLPYNQIAGQHRECCALRGLSWGRKHETVDYAFKYKLRKLELYHMLVIQEYERRGAHVDSKWKYVGYRGKRVCGEKSVFSALIPIVDRKIYSEHNQAYYKECIENLKGKGIVIGEEF